MHLSIQLNVFVLPGSYLTEGSDDCFRRDIVRGVRQPRGRTKSSAGRSASVLFGLGLWRSTPQVDVEFVSEQPCLLCRVVSSYVMNMQLPVRGLLL